MWRAPGPLECPDRALLHEVVRHGLLGRLALEQLALQPERDLDLVIGIKRIETNTALGELHRNQRVQTGNEEQLGALDDALETPIEVFGGPAVAAQVDLFRIQLVRLIDDEQHFPVAVFGVLSPWDTCHRRIVINLPGLLKI